MDSAPIFIIGTERSGSNLLRLILNSHSSIAVPHPPHILKYFSPFENNYGDLCQHKNLKRLTDDILGLLAVHVYPWELHLEPEKIVAGVPSPDVIGVFYSIYNAYQKHCGKRRWACKSTFMIHHIAKIVKTCPAAKFLWLVRDPRDVAASSRKSIFSPFHPYFTARLWRAQQLLGLQFYEGQGADRCCLIRYEDLIGDPVGTVGKICRFIEEDYEPAMLQFYRSKSAQKSESLSGAWKNTASPILSGNMNKFVEELSPSEIELIENETGNLMARFGYTFSCQKQAERFQEKTPATAISSVPPKGALYTYRLMNCYWTILVETRSLFSDKNYLRFWARRIFLLRLRLRYFFTPIAD
ncbi:MAG: sulfotransferase [Pseudomonadota bacterium]